MVPICNVTYYLILVEIKLWVSLGIRWSQEILVFRMSMATGECHSIQIIETFVLYLLVAVSCEIGSW